MTTKQTILKFESATCTPCKKIAPIVERLAAEFGVELRKIDVALDKKTPQHFGVRSIPTLILMQNGKELRRITGGVSEQKLRDFLRG